ncbi:hypothetical protein N8T08_001202 [Aspergillus melleus]|uniref:Uncharacterized protein n=1 Tax=Aspergillus melleus TaxID=138277 RepID=A0ACC3ANW4_9EURO|nr:hypothetical protein N8T08_001202 [Aspergillus melleus]
MSAPVFFPNDLWVGQEVHFTLPSPSTWIIDGKIGAERCLWMDHEQAALGEVSEAVCIFSCHNGDIEGTMHVSMQIPYHGSEFLPAGIRQKQAASKLTDFLERELEAAELLRVHGCEHVAQPLGLLRGVQDMDGLVPGGWIVHYVLSKVPGVPLGEPTMSWKKGIQMQDGLFWGLERVKRDQIRAGFQEAYR